MCAIHRTLSSGVLADVGGENSDQAGAAAGCHSTLRVPKVAWVSNASRRRLGAGQSRPSVGGADPGVCRHSGDEGAPAVVLGLMYAAHRPLATRAKSRIRFPIRRELGRRPEAMLYFFLSDIPLTGASLVKGRSGEELDDTARGGCSCELAGGYRSRLRE